MIRLRKMAGLLAASGCGLAVGWLLGRAGRRHRAAAGQSPKAAEQVAFERGGPHTSAESKTEPSSATTDLADRTQTTTNHTGRSVIVAVVTATALVAMPILGLTWYSRLASTPSPPIASGGLYLVVDQPDVEAELSVVVSDPEGDQPSIRVAVALNNRNARYALVAQGSWAFSSKRGRDSSRAHTSAPEPGTFTTTPETRYLAIKEKPSVVVVGENPQPSLLAAQLLEAPAVEGYLSHAVQVSGRGRERGYLPPINARLVGPVAITGTKGTWTRPKATQISVALVHRNSFAHQVASVDPPASLMDYGLQWSTTDAVGRLKWELLNPDQESYSDQGVFLIGVSLGIWGSIVVAVAQHLLSRWVAGARR